MNREDRLSKNISPLGNFSAERLTHCGRLYPMIVLIELVTKARLSTNQAFSINNKPKAIVPTRLTINGLIILKLWIVSPTYHELQIGTT